VTLIKEIY
jgi:hypothetical protein